MPLVPLVASTTSSVLLPYWQHILPRFASQHVLQLESQLEGRLDLLP